MPSLRLPLGRCKASALGADESIVHTPDEPPDRVSNHKQVYEPDECPTPRHTVPRQVTAEERQVRPDVFAPLQHEQGGSEKQSDPKQQPDGDAPCARIEPEQRIQLFVAIHLRPPLSA